MKKYRIIVTASLVAALAVSAAAFAKPAAKKPEPPRQVQIKAHKAPAPAQIVKAVPAHKAPAAHKAPVPAKPAPKAKPAPALHKKAPVPHKPAHHSHHRSGGSEILAIAAALLRLSS